MILKIEFKMSEAFDKFKEVLKGIDKDIILIALCGGSSVGDFYEEIGKRIKELPYERLRFFMLDERFKEDERNFILIQEKIINNLSENLKRKISGNFFALKGRTIEQATKNYEIKLKKINPEMVFDVIVASSGEDCHVASLFPNHRLLDEKKRGYGFLDDSPKPPKERISLLPESIIHSKFGFLFFIGEKKDDAYKKFLGEGDWRECPARLFKKINHYVVR